MRFRGDEEREMTEAYLKYKYNSQPNNPKISTCFGIEWKEITVPNITAGSYIYELYNEKFGELRVTEKAMRFFVEHSELDYKVLSLLYEKHCYGISLELIADDETSQLSAEPNDITILKIHDFLLDFPQGILDKQLRALLCLYKRFPNYGEHINECKGYHFFCKDEKELGFIINLMANRNWLNAKASAISDGTWMIRLPIIIAEEGYLVVEKHTNTLSSNQVFIAMKFKDMDSVRDAIKRAIIDCGLIPNRIDEKEHVNNISSEIQKDIIESRFLVADVTGQNQGVYFEAGYAMAHKITVLFCCKEDDFKNVHFDTKQYNHIVWKDEDDLYDRLKRRLKALL
jgi:hypothetical protein